jgi:hypothetical protein
LYFEYKQHININQRIYMGPSLSCGFRQVCEARQEMKLAHFIGETSGDIPIFSLHKIVRQLSRRPIPVSAEIVSMLKRGIIASNKEYREDTGLKWNCLPANYLIECLLSIDKQVSDLNETALGTLPKDMVAHRLAFKKLFEKKRAECQSGMRTWFDSNYDRLFYDMSGSVPWAVVQRLRRNLSIWALGVSNPFEQNVNEMILEVAKENNLSTDDPVDAWEALGGRVFTAED